MDVDSSWQRGCLRLMPVLALGGGTDRRADFEHWGRMVEQPGRNGSRLDLLLLDDAAHGWTLQHAIPEGRVVLELATGSSRRTPQV